MGKSVCIWYPAKMLKLALTIASVSICIFVAIADVPQSEISQNVENLDSRPNIIVKRDAAKKNTKKGSNKKGKKKAARKSKKKRKGGKKKRKGTRRKNCKKGKCQRKRDGKSRKGDGKNAGKGDKKKNINKKNGRGRIVKKANVKERGMENPR